MRKKKVIVIVFSFLSYEHDNAIFAYKLFFIESAKFSLVFPRVKLNCVSSNYCCNLHENGHKIYVISYKHFLNDNNNIRQNIFFFIMFGSWDFVSLFDRYNHNVVTFFGLLTKNTHVVQNRTFVLEKCDDRVHLPIIMLTIFLQRTYC